MRDIQDFLLHGIGPKAWRRFRRRTNGVTDPQLIADEVIEAVIAALKPEEIWRRHEVCERAYREGPSSAVYEEALSIAGARGVADGAISLASGRYLLASIRLAKRVQEGQ